MRSSGATHTDGSVRRSSPSRPGVWWFLAATSGKESPSASIASGPCTASCRGPGAAGAAPAAVAPRVARTATSATALIPLMTRFIPVTPRKSALRRADLSKETSDGPGGAGAEEAGEIAGTLLLHRRGQLLRRRSGVFRPWHGTEHADRCRLVRP